MQEVNESARPGLEAHAKAMASLRQLHDVCKRMECENDLEKPTEAEYQAALDEAERALATMGWPVMTGGA